MKRLILVLLMMSFFLGACSSTGAQDEMQATIDAAFQEYGDSLVAKDADRWGTLWTEDGLQMPPGEPLIDGRAALVSSVNAMFDFMTVTDMEVNTQEIQVAGDWAYARGNYTLTYEMNDGSDAGVIDGKYLTIFQKQTDGSWKMYRDIYNSNTPD